MKYSKFTKLTELNATVELAIFAFAVKIFGEKKVDAELRLLNNNVALLYASARSKLLSDYENVKIENINGGKK